MRLRMIDGGWREGRAKLGATRWMLRLEWNLWARFCGAEVERTYEGGWKLMLAFPPVAIWLTFSLGFRPAKEREISVRVHDWALWWRLWVDPMSWDSRTPRWRDGAWHVLDTLFGRPRYTEGKGEPRAVVVPMPEGAYLATITIRTDTWRRPLWFPRSVSLAIIDVPQGIPHEGKGESAHDCGTQRTYGFTCPARTVEEGIAAMVRSSLRDRRRYDGNVMAVYPAPAPEVTQLCPSPAPAPPVSTAHPSTDSAG